MTTALLLVAGHESGAGHALDAAALEPAGAAAEVVRPGRSLERALAAADPSRPVVVLPMTVGRDPRLISDTARTVRWMARERPVALAPPLGTVDHLVGWLRAACLRVPHAEAVVLAAAAADPFDDAELYRVAALVRVNAPARLVEVGLRGAHGGVEEARDRCRLLGARTVAVVAAELGTPLDVDLPLLSPASKRSVVAARVATALHRLRDHGDDGIAAAHAADHARGFAHAHHDHGHHHELAHAPLGAG